MDVAVTRERAREAAEEGSWPQWMARAGLVTRGVLHGVVGLLALRLAAGDESGRADHKGALAAVVRQPLGRVLVLALAAGLLAYAGWRLLEAVLDPERKGALKRVGYLARGLLYVGLFWTAVTLALPGGQGREGGRDQQDLTADVLGWPFGPALVVGAGLAVVAMGAWNLWQGLTKGFAKHLKAYEMTGSQRRWTCRIALVGHLARAVALGVAGGFLVRAGIRHDASTGVGLDASLRELLDAPYGPWLLALVAGGLIAFGAFQLVLARFRRVLGD